MQKITSKHASTSLIITCFNYEQYVTSAITSALNQSHPFDEIIVIDDCSTDNSVKIIQDAIQNIATAQLITFEKNLGQLAAFQIGFNKSRCELIFFLDADDIFHVDHCLTILKAAEQHPDADFLYSNHTVFTDSEFFEWRKKNDNAEQTSSSIDLGCSAVSTLLTRQYIGAPTSCLALKRQLLSTILNFPCEMFPDWRTRADDCLVFGASLAGSKKLAISAITVGYRKHEHNALLGNHKIGNSRTVFQRQISLVRLWRYFFQEFRYDKSLIDSAYLEFKTIPKPTFNQFLFYLNTIVRYGSGNVSRIRSIGVIVKHFIHKGPQI